MSRAHRRAILLSRRPYKWELCLGCGPFIRCPTCRGNCGFENPRYHEKHGRFCPTCPKVKAAWKKAIADGDIPERPEFKPEAIMKARSERRREMEAAGVKFATLEDLLAI